MGGDFKSVVNATNCYPGMVLIVRHQFMRESDELSFSGVSRPGCYPLQLKRQAMKYLWSLSQATASVRRSVRASASQAKSLLASTL